MIPAFHVGAFVRVRTEEVTLRLHQVCRRARAAVSVKVRERTAHGRHGNTGVDGGGDDATPRSFAFDHFLGELLVNEKRRELGVSVVSVLDAVQEAGANDAAALPDARHFAEVQVPALLVGLGANQVHALGVGSHLGSVQSISHVVDELLFVRRAHGAGGCQAELGVKRLGVDAFILQSGQASGVKRARDRRRSDGQFRGLLHRPLSSALHASLVEDLVHQKVVALARLVVLLGQNDAGDLDEVRFQLRLVPFRERSREFIVRQPADGFQHVVRFGDELHVAVLDAVVHHLDKVPGASWADVRHARPRIGLRAHGL